MLGAGTPAANRLHTRPCIFSDARGGSRQHSSFPSRVQKTKHASLTPRTSLLPRPTTASKLGREASPEDTQNTALDGHLGLTCRAEPSRAAPEEGAAATSHSRRRAEYINPHPNPNPNPFSVETGTTKPSLGRTNKIKNSPRVIQRLLLCVLPARRYLPCLHADVSIPSPPSPSPSPLPLPLLVPTTTPASLPELAGADEAGTGLPPERWPF